MTESVGSTLFGQGWVQGAYLFCNELSDKFHECCWASSKDLSEELQRQLTDRRNALILLSQTCDIVALCHNEKTLEFVIARKPKKNKPPHYLNLDARSSRFLELELSGGHWYKAEAAKILQVSKQDFLREINHKKIQVQLLEEAQRETLARWRANRYMRIALPDGFNNKIKHLIEDEKLFDDGLEHAGSLYLNLEPFAESENYIVRLFALHRCDSPDNTYDVLFEKMGQIIEKINAVDGLICPYMSEENNDLFQDILPVMRRHEVTVDVLDNFVRWNFDYVSLSDSDSEGIDYGV